MTPENPSPTAASLVRQKSAPRLSPVRAKQDRGKRGLLVALWTLAAAGIVAICFLPADRPAMAFPLEVKGKVMITLSGHGGNGQPLPPGQPFAAGRRLTVSDGASAVVVLLPGITAQAEDTTDFSVDELVMRKRGAGVESRRAAVTVYAGRIRCAVTMPENRQADLRISTPAGTVECEPGSVLSVVVSPQETRVVCGWGILRWKAITGSAGTTFLLAGEFCDRTAVSVPSTTTRKVTEDARAQEEMASILRVATAVDALEADRRLHSRPFFMSKD